MIYLGPEETQLLIAAIEARGSDGDDVIDSSSLRAERLAVLPAEFLNREAIFKEDRIAEMMFFNVPVLF